MINNHIIENDDHYRRLSSLLVYTPLNPVERVLFLSEFESFYCLLPYARYERLITAAIVVAEECANV